MNQAPSSHGLIPYILTPTWGGQSPPFESLTIFSYISQDFHRVEFHSSFLLRPLSQAPKNLHTLLESVLSGSGSESEINSLVRLAFNVASFRLRQLVKSGRLHLHSFAISVEGIAFDCIAERFQRDECGSFVELEGYFSESRSLQILDEHEVEHYFRRLVFSKLNEGIFRLYRENDPVLGRILRNLKTAAQSTRGLKQFERPGQVYVYTCGEDHRNDQLPEFPIDQIQTEHARASHKNENSLEYLKKFFEILNDQQQFRRFYALIDIATLPSSSNVYSSSAGPRFWKW